MIPKLDQFRPNNKKSPATDQRTEKNVNTWTMQKLKCFQITEAVRCVCVCECCWQNMVETSAQFGPV